MTTTQERSGKYCTDPATKQKDEYYLGLDEQEVKILRNSLRTLLSIGTGTTPSGPTIQNIYQKLNANLNSLKGNSSASSSQRQLRELKQELHTLRKRINELEDQIEVGEHLV